MSKHPILVTCLTLALGAACDGKSGGKSGGKDGGATGGTSKGATVGATLPEANVCGTGSVALTKQVPLSFDTLPPDLEVGPAWVAHSREDYVSYLYGAIKVTNKGSVGHCFVKAGSISYRDQAGQEVKNRSLSYIYGRVRALSSVSTWTCLDPGDSAYFNLIDQVSYFDVASIHVGTFTYDDGGKSPLADIVATDFTANGNTVSIDVDNLGTGSAKNVSMVVYALSAAGEFEYWTFASITNREIWPPGEQRTASVRFSYEAPCAKLLTVPYFDAAEVSLSTLADEEILANAQGTAAVDALMAARLRQAEEAESAKLEFLRR